MANGFGIELEEGALVALFGVLLLPGVLWVASAKSGKSMAVRSSVVVGLIASALAIEAAMDRTANEVGSILD